MASQDDAISAVRRYIELSSDTLRNVQFTGTCPVCHGIPGQGYVDCRQCRQYRTEDDTADLLGFILYAINGEQSGQMMRAYKNTGQTTTELVGSLLTYSIVVHWRCIPRILGIVPDSWAVVPSLSGRAGPHPLASLASSVMRNIPQVDIRAGTGAHSPRNFRPRNFTVHGDSGDHVLLLDDTWTTGGHLQSAAAALKLSGAETVTGLVVARWLNPDWANTKNLISSLPATFNPDLCPFDGTPCKHPVSSQRTQIETS